MYRIFALLLFAASGCSPFSQSKSVGIAFSSRPDVLDSAGMRARWNDFLQANGHSEQLNPVVIRRARDETTNKLYYYLIAETPSGNLSLARLLTRKERHFFINPARPEFCLCDCEGARPTLVDGEWKCLGMDFTESCEAEILRPLVAGK